MHGMTKKYTVAFNSRQWIIFHATTNQKHVNVVKERMNQRSGQGRVHSGV
jgi:hypothetical protein